MTKVDPNWTLEQALEEQGRYEESLGRESLTGPLMDWATLNEIEHCKNRFDGGDKSAALDAIQKCFATELPVPKWASEAFIRCHRRVSTYRASSWDEAFGPPHKKGTHLGKARQREKLGPAIWIRVREIRIEEPNTPVDRALFERVAEEFGIGRTLAEELYYSSRRRLHRMFKVT